MRPIKAVVLALIIDGTAAEETAEHLDGLHQVVAPDGDCEACSFENMVNNRGPGASRMSVTLAGASVGVKDSCGRTLSST